MTTTENRATKRHDAIRPDPLHNSRKRGTIHASIRSTLFPYPFVPFLRSRFLFSFFTFNFSINLLPLALSVSPIHPLIHIFPARDDERVVFCSLTEYVRIRIRIYRIFQFSSIEETIYIFTSINFKLISSKYYISIDNFPNRDIIFTREKT